MNAKRYASGVEWLSLHGFSAAHDYEPCCSWTNEDGVMVWFGDRSKWVASFNGWHGEWGNTPKSAISNLRKACIRLRDKMFKEAQAHHAAAERLGKALADTLREECAAHVKRPIQERHEGAGGADR